MEPIDGIYCAYGDCKEYDGKRCKKLGHQPTAVCEPYALELFNEKRQKINSAGDKKFSSKYTREEVLEKVEQLLDLCNEGATINSLATACLAWSVLNGQR